MSATSFVVPPLLVLLVFAGRTAAVLDVAVGSWVTTSSELVVLATAVGEDVAECCGRGLDVRVEVGGGW